MARIFICYRREDASGHAGRLLDALSARFGPGEIFRDLETIGPGEDFVQAMSRAVSSCHVFLAVIGRHWLAATRPDGTRRLDDPEDHVRSEIVEALQRGVRLIPVLVQGAVMPRAGELPEALRGLARRNAIAVDDDDWSSDVERLAAAIRRELQPAAEVDAAGLTHENLAGGAAAKPAPGSHARITPRRVLAFVVGAALVAALAVLSRGGPEGAPDDATSAAPANAPAAGQAAASVNPAPTGPETPVTLPAGGEAELDTAVYEILEAGVRPHHRGSTLTLRIRLTNRGRYDTTFFDSAFRLLLNGEPRAPASGLIEVVPAESAKDGTITFELPSGAATGTLRIARATETGEIPLDFGGRHGLTPAQDLEARRAGSTTFPVAIDPATAAMRFEGLSCELRAATVRRYAHKLTLTLHLRVRNRGRSDAVFGDGQFRLLLGEDIRAPVSGLSEIVAAEAVRDGDIVFDLPLEIRQVLLRARFGETSAELPLQLPFRAPAGS